MVPPAEGDDEVIIDYRVYCNSLGDRTRHVDDTHAFLDPAATFVYSPEFRALPARIRIVAPEGWQTATGLDPDPADTTLLYAPSYDVLIDSPLEIGFHDTIRFEVDQVPHEIDVWTGRKDGQTGLGAGYDKAKLISQFSGVIRAERDIFGDFPFKRYVFIVHCVPGAGGGTEHLNSTVMQTRPEVFADDASVKRFMSLMAHEYAHTWNVKQLRPAGLKPLDGLYDLQHENYTDLLWVSEGTTDYIQRMALVRAGVTSPDDLLKGLGTMIETARSRPGVSVQSAAQSSFDAWIDFDKSWPDAVNTTVSFYDKGEWASLVLDLEIRKRSGNKASLDSLLRELYHSFPLAGPGFTQEDMIRTAERLTISNFHDWFADYITGTRPLEFEGALAEAGLEVVQEPARNEGEKAAEKPVPESAEKPATARVPLAPRERAYVGLNAGADGTVTSVLADGPAYKAGLIAGDVVAAINGQRLKGDLDAHLKRLKPGDAVKVTFFRYDRLHEIEFKADGRFDGKWTVRRVKNPTGTQRALYESWSGQKWPEIAKKDEAK
jgi:predicted metalloprotease with PDZ domain